MNAEHTAASLLAGSWDRNAACFGSTPTAEEFARSALRWALEWNSRLLAHRPADSVSP